MKNEKVLIVALISLFILGCAKGIKPTQSHLTQRQTEITRTQLQLQLSQLSDAIWLRTGALIFVNSNLPLTSGNPATLDKIKTDLRRQILHAQEKVNEVDDRVRIRYQQENPINQFTIKLLKIELNGNKLDVNEHIQSVSLVKGEVKDWNIAWRSDNKAIKITLVLSETGELFIEGQGVLTVSPWMSNTPFVTSINWFEQSIRSQDQLNLTLQPILQ